MFFKRKKDESDLYTEKSQSENSLNENGASENSQNKKERRHGKGRFNILNPFKNSYIALTQADQEKRDKTIFYGLLSILFSCLCVAFVYPCVRWGAQGVVYGFTHNLGPLTYFLAVGNIFVIVGSMGFMFFPVGMAYYGIRLVFMQFLLNRRAIRWIALVVWIICLIGSFLLTLENIFVIAGMGHLFG